MKNLLTLPFILVIISISSVCYAETSEPTRAYRFLGGTYVVPISDKMKNLDADTYEVEPTGEYKDYNENVIVEAGKATSVFAELKPLQTISKGRPGETWVEPVTGMEFVWVPGGCYEMGCGNWDEDCADSEKPVHEVCLDGFWIGKYEVTQGQWEKVMGNNPSLFKKGENYPVETVSWNDVDEFIKKLSTMNNNVYGFRLPTEAEWEYAARSGGKNEKYSGGNDVTSVAWYDKNSGDSIHPVGTKSPNGLNIYDMSGNVYEWCEDIYSEAAYSQHQHNNPINTGGSYYRMIRGGSRLDPPANVRCTNRLPNIPAGKSFILGFRLARTPNPEEKSAE